MDKYLINRKRYKRNLKILFIFIISAFLVLEFLPTVYSTTVTGNISGQVGDYGVLQALDNLIEDMEQKSKSAQIENETQKRLDDMKLTEYTITPEDLDYDVKEINAPDPQNYEPIIFNALKQNPIVNNTSILDFLFDNPLNYWIFTRSNAKDTWTKGMLRRTLILNGFNPTKWEYIDVDQNASTGADDINTVLISDPHHEVRVRFEIEIKDYKIDLVDDPIRILPKLNLNLKAGFGITVERLVNTSFPLELYIAKSISYEGENYIWTTGLKFDETPQRYEAELLADKINLGDVRELIINGSVFNLTNAVLAEINGPYSLIFNYNLDVKRFDLMAGLVKYENQSLTDKNWLVFYLTPADGQNYITRSGEVWIDSSNVQAPIDNLKWTAGVFDSTKIPIDLKIRYGEVRRHFVFANVDLINLPKWFSIKIDYTKVVDNNNITVLDYKASGILGELNYTSYIFPNFMLGSNKFNCTHVLIEDVPENYHMEMTTDIGRDINTTPYYNPKNGFVANLLNNLIVRFANRFYRIGKYLKLVAEGILELPSKNGWALIDAKGKSFGNLEFYQSSSMHLDYPGNYIGFYNTSSSIPSSRPLTRSSDSAIVISGRLTGLSWANLSFGTPLEFELRAFNNESFKALFIERDDYAVASFSNVPGYLKVVNEDNNSIYSTIDPEKNDGEEGTKIDEFRFTSKIGNNLMQVKILGIPETLEFNRQDEVISFSTYEGSSLEELSFVITSDDSKKLYQLGTGDFLAVVQDDDFIMGSGRLSGIMNLTYVNTEDGYIELNMEAEKTLNVEVINNKPTFTKAKMIIDPLPANFKLELPGIIKQTSINFPDITNMTGLLDFSKLVFTLGKLGNDLVDLLGNITQNLVESIGNIGFNFSISYNFEGFETQMDMIAEIERDGIPLSEEAAKQNNDLYSSATDKVLGSTLGWTHGITMQQDLYEGREILRGHLYLQGMPKAASLTTFFTENTTNVEFDFSEYNPRYNWLLLDLKGIQNRDVKLFFQKIPNNVDFYATAEIITNLEIGGEMQGEVEFLIRDSGSDVCTQELGALYIYMHTYEPIQSIREFLISELPAELLIDFQIQKEMHLIYEASTEIEFIYSKLSKSLTDSWHHVNLILHDLPLEFRFDYTGNTDFDIDDPLPLQGLPRLNIETYFTNTLDIRLSLDSAAVGQRGNVELFIEDVQDTTAKIKDDSYDIESIGLDFFKLKITNLPILDNYRINSIILEAQELESLVFKVNLLFGVFPYFDLGSNIRGKIEITLDHTIKLFGSDLDAQVALIDIVYEDVAGAKIPVATPIFVNSINSHLKKSQNHVIVPAVLVSLFISWYNSY